MAMATMTCSNTWRHTCRARQPSRCRELRPVPCMLLHTRVATSRGWANTGSTSWAPLQAAVGPLQAWTCWW